MNNPIRFIDPDGMDTVNIQQGSGQLENHIETDKGNDVFNIVDKDGNQIEGQSLTFDEGTLEAVREPTVNVRQEDGTIKEETLTLFEIKGDENASELFEFIVNAPDPDDENIEWNDAKIGTESSGRNIVGTSHQEGSTAAGAYLRETGYTLRTVTHNHPSGVGRPSSGDRASAAAYNTKNKDTKLFIYIQPAIRVPYNQNGVIVK
jgi:hypothetical protein